MPRADNPSGAFDSSQMVTNEFGFSEITFHYNQIQLIKICHHQNASRPSAMLSSSVKAARRRAVLQASSITDICPIGVIEQKGQQSRLCRVCQ